MTDHLFEPPKPVRALTDRQQRAFDYIRSTLGGVTADELGAHIHGHSDDAPRCEWCARAGREVATSAALKPLVVYRRSTHRFEPRDPAQRAQEPSMQLAELQGETWDDLFGSAA